MALNVRRRIVNRQKIEHSVSVSRRDDTCCANKIHAMERYIFFANELGLVNCWRNCFNRTDHLPTHKFNYPSLIGRNGKHIHSAYLLVIRRFCSHCCCCCIRSDYSPFPHSLTHLLPDKVNGFQYWHIHTHTQSDTHGWSQRQEYFIISQPNWYRKFDYRENSIRSSDVLDNIGTERANDRSEEVERGHFIGCTGQNSRRTGRKIASASIDVKSVRTLPSDVYSRWLRNQFISIISRK